MANKKNQSAEDNLDISGYPSEAQIKEWKEKYGENSLHELKVEGEGCIILREPQLPDLERAQASDPKKNKPYNFHRSLIGNCKLYETPGFLSKNENLLAIFSMLDEIVEIKEASRKKL